MSAPPLTDGVKATVFADAPDSDLVEDLQIVLMEHHVPDGLRETIIDMIECWEIEKCAA